MISRVDAAAPFPPLELAERLVRATPGDLATFSIERLGKAALPLLASGVTALVLAAGTALATLRARHGSVLPIAGYAIVLAGAASSGPSRASLVSVAWTVVLGAVVYGVALVAITGDRDPGTAEDETLLGMTRRGAVLAAGGALATVLGAGAVLGPIVDGARVRARSFALRRPDEVRGARARTLRPTIEGRPPEVTPVADHYVVDIDLIDPSLSAGSWELEVTGAVARPLRLGIDALQRDFRLVEEPSVLTCISNEVGGSLVGSSGWTGVRMADVLRRAGVRPGAGELGFRCADGYTSALSLAQARDPSVLLAIAQNGRPLTQAHGFPCRLRVPALYGMKNPKWLVAIEVRRSRLAAYWVRRGWSDTAVVRTASRIDVAPDAQAGRPVWIAGVAWAGARGISGVELSFDAGATWRPARLQAPLASLAWTQWAYRYTSARSRVQTVACRAVDGDGRPQDARRRPPHPSGSSGYHEVQFQVT